MSQAWGKIMQKTTKDHKPGIPGVRVLLESGGQVSVGLQSSYQHDVMPRSVVLSPSPERIPATSDASNLQMQPGCSEAALAQFSGSA